MLKVNDVVSRGLLDTVGDCSIDKAVVSLSIAKGSAVLLFDTSAKLWDLLRGTSKVIHDLTQALSSLSAARLEEQLQPIFHCVKTMVQILMHCDYILADEWCKVVAPSVRAVLDHWSALSEPSVADFSCKEFETLVQDAGTKSDDVEDARSEMVNKMSDYHDQVGTFIRSVLCPALNAAHIENYDVSAFEAKLDVLVKRAAVNTAVFKGTALLADIVTGFKVCVL